MKYLSKRFFAHMGILMFLCCALLLISCNQPSSKYVIALKPDKNPESMIEERTALSSLLSQSTQRPIEVIVPTSSAVILEGFANGTIDAGYLSATEMIQATDRGIAELFLVGEIQGKTSYASYWVCLTEKPYQKIDDLKGLNIAFSSKTSTSGYVIPHHDLILRGLIPTGEKPEAFFGADHVWYGTGYVSAVERVLSGEAEAAAISYYVLDLDKHLKPEQKARLRKFQEQGPVPTHCIAIRKSLEPTQKAKLQSAFMTLNEEPNQALRDKVFTSKLVETDPETHLSPLREALKAIGK